MYKKSHFKSGKAINKFHFDKFDGLSLIEKLRHVFLNAD